MDAYIARYTVMAHRVALINGIVIGPGQRAFFLLVGTGCTQASMWNFLHTLNGRLPTDENQFRQVVGQLRRYGHMVEQNQPHHGRYMPTGIELNDIHQQPEAMTGMRFLLVLRRLPESAGEEPMAPRLPRP